MHLNCFLVRMVHVNGSDLCATLKDFALWFHFNFTHFDLISTSDKNIDGGKFRKTNNSSTIIKKFIHDFSHNTDLKKNEIFQVYKRLSSFEHYDSMKTPLRTRR